MQSTLNPKLTDDPHDFVVVPPGVARVAPADEELSNLLHKAARYSSSLQARAPSDVAAGPTVPPVDATFRPAAVGDVRVPGKRWPMVRRAARGFVALLLAACIGLAAVAWRSYGDTAKKQIAKWTTQIVLMSSLSGEKPPPPAQPAAPEVQADAAAPAPEVQADAAAPAPPQPAAPAETAAEAVAPAAAAPSGDSAQLMQSMARDLASLGQQVEQLKASIDELKASQQQISREVAKASEQNSRPRIPAVSAPPRPAVARPRKPIPPYPPAQAAAAPPLQQTAAPYVPRQPDYYAPRPIEPPPQTTAEPPADPELSSVPRPPMPVR